MTDCKDCKYYRNKTHEEVTDYRSYNLLPRMGYCDRARQLWDCTEWFDDGTDNYDSCNLKLKPKYKNNKMFVKDGSDYSADLLVTEDFGCKEFKEKPNETNKLQSLE